MPRVNRIERAGMALSDFGENLGRFAYLQAQIQNAKDDNERMLMQQELYREKMKIESAADAAMTGRTLYAGAQQTGATPAEQNTIGQMLGMPNAPLTEEGPINQLVPGLQTRESLLQQQGDKSYAEAINTFAGSHAFAQGTSPESMRSTLLSEEEEKASKSAMAYATAEVWKDKQLRANLDKWYEDTGREMHLTDPQIAKWRATKKLDEDLTDNEVLTAARQLQAFAAAQTTNLGVVIDTQSQMLTANVSTGAIKQYKADGVTLTPEYEKAANYIANLRNTKYQLDNGILDALPQWPPIKDRLLRMGKYQEFMGGGEQDIATQLVTAKKKRDELLKKMQPQPTITPAQGALGGGM